MNQLILGLTLLVGFAVASMLFLTAYIDSHDCNQYDHGWDQICLEKQEFHKASILQTIPIVTIVLSIILIILIPYKPNDDHVGKRRNDE